MSCQDLQLYGSLSQHLEAATQRCMEGQGYEDDLVAARALVEWRFSKAAAFRAKEEENESVNESVRIPSWS